MDQRVLTFATELFDRYPDSRIDPVLILAQADLETGGFTSDYWDQGNSGGIGIWQPGVPSPFTTKDYRAAAQIHLANMLVRTNPQVNLSKFPLAVKNEGFMRYVDRVIDLFTQYPQTIATTDDLSKRFGINNRECVWACDDSYAVKIEGRIKKYLKGAPMSYTVDIPGLPGGPVELPFPLDVETFMLSDSNTYQNPGIDLSRPFRWVQHGTGNPTSLARGDAAWVYNGADGIQESMHFELDDKEGFQLIRIGKVSWQAADGPGPGNMNGISCEMSENEELWADPTRRANLIRNAAVLGGIIAARLSIAIPEQHYTFNFADPNRHDCPYKLRHTPGAWDSFVSQWQAAKAAELNRMGKTNFAPKHPLPRKSFKNADGTIYFAFPQTVTLKALEDVKPLEWANSPNVTGPTIKAGTNANFSHLTSDEKGALWLVGTGGSRLPLSAFVK